MADWAVTLVTAVILSALTAIATIWAALLRTRTRIELTVLEAFNSAMREMALDRNELIEMIKTLHRENVKLRKTLKEK